jgi:HEAT repeat protein
MGLFDTIMGWFGIGGASVAVTLDGNQVPQGGFLSGKVKVTGGDREQPMTALRVQLVFVSVKSREDSAIPEINMTVLLDNVLATGKTISPKAVTEYPFQFQIPDGTEPTGSGVTYQVKASAEIPGAKDPNGMVELKVVEGTGQTADALLLRWPALRGTEPEPLIDALQDMRWKHDKDDPENDLLAAEPVLARLVREGSPRVQAAALPVWARILGDRATADHVKTVQSLVEKDLDDDVRREVIQAASAFRKQGGMAILAKLAQSPDAEVRRLVAAALDRWDGPFIGTDLEQLRKMVDDADPAVRAEAVRALGTYYENTSATEKIAEVASKESDVSVLEACTRALSNAAYKDRKELMLAHFEKMAARPEIRLRLAVAGSIPQSSTLAGDPRVRAIVDRLLADTEEDVRHDMAFQLNNLVQNDDSLADVAEHVLWNDPSQRVRGAAVSALCKDGLVEKRALPAYEKILAADASEEVLRGMIFGLRWREEQGAKGVLHRLTAHPNRTIAERAREALGQ